MGALLGRVRGVALALCAGVLLVAGAGANGGCNDRSIRLASKREPEVKVRDVVRGAGAPVGEGKRVEAHYTVTLEDGSTLVTTRGGEAHAFIVGDGTVIEGLDHGIRGMRLGGRREVRVPPELHWGRAGYAGRVGENTWVKIDVELVGVN